MKIVRRSLAPLVGLLVLTLLGAGSPHAAAQEPAAIDFPSLTMTYRDADGVGSVTLINQGADPASGGSRIDVILIQNGRTFQGHGFVRQTGTVSFVGAFGLTDDADNAYMMVGTFVRGFAGWSGQGRYEMLRNPAVVGEWTMSMLPCPVC